MDKKTKETRKGGAYDTARRRQAARETSKPKAAMFIAMMKAESIATKKNTTI